MYYVTNCIDKSLVLRRLLSVSAQHSHKMDELQQPNTSTWRHAFSSLVSLSLAASKGPCAFSGASEGSNHAEFILIQVNTQTYTVLKEWYMNEMLFFFFYFKKVPLYETPGRQGVNAFYPVIEISKPNSNVGRSCIWALLWYEWVGNVPALGIPFFYINCMSYIHTHPHPKQSN